MPLPKPATITLKNYLSLVIGIALLLSHGASYAQSLSKKELASAVKTISKLIEANYVFAGKGKKIAAHLLYEYEKGKFDRANDWEEFSSLSTGILRDFSGDGHLYVRYDPKKVKELSTDKNDATGANKEDAFFHGMRAREKNYGFAEVKVLEGNIGYIKLSEINVSEKSLPVLIAAMQFVSNTKVLIIDLRDNGGGGSEIGPVFESFFLPKNIALLEFKSRKGEVEVARTVPWLTQNKYEGPLYILINKGTASAAEAFAYSLQKIRRAKIVGQPSAGAAHMNSWYVVNEHIFVSVSTGAPTLPGTEESWEQKGVQPDHLVAPGEEIEFIRRVAINER